MEQLKILEILEKNRDKDFVDRILNAKKFPTLENIDGSESTHGMMYSEVDGVFYVYPSVIIEDDNMRRLERDSALGRAVRLGDYVEFDSIQEAYEFSKEYKKMSPFFDAKKDDNDRPLPPSMWKGLNTGPGPSSGDSMSGVSDGN